MAKSDLHRKLSHYRKAIDALDDKILALLEERAGLAQQVGETKRAHRLSDYAVLEREAQILRRVKRKSGLLKKGIQSIYTEIISACLACEKQLAVCYLGPPGTYSHEAALKMFGRSAKLSPTMTITSTIRDVEKEHANFAIVPFENSAAGAVGETMDALPDTTLQICGETVLRVRHSLLASSAGLAPRDIKTVYGHPQALEQCRRWLEKQMPQAVLTATGSTAAAAKKVADGGKKIAAIGSPLAKEIYKLSVIAADIEDYSNNSTRFLVLGRTTPAESGEDKTSFIVSVRDEAGAMYKLLKPLADNHVTMTKFESRPSPGRLWKYLFFIDIIGHQDDDAVRQALEGMRARAPFMKILGSYPSAV